jgi:hypothetical protein
MTIEINPESRRKITVGCIPEAQRSLLDRYRTWPRFHRGVRKPGLPLLKNLPRYRRCVLVAGCQRSGTTMLTRLIAGSPGFTGFALTVDDELDAALALAGLIDLPDDRRYCFQTTYLNECFGDYRQLAADQRLIWVLRNPYSVVYSMLHNWNRFALNELYDGCGIPLGASARLRRTRLLWPFGPSRIEKASFAYRGKAAQILSIQRQLRPDQLLLVNYDLLVAAPEQWLPRVFAFADVPYEPGYARQVRSDPVRKADRLSRRAHRKIELVAWPTYRECVALTAAGDSS